MKRIQRLDVLLISAVLAIGGVVALVLQTDHASGHPTMGPDPEPLRAAFAERSAGAASTLGPEIRAARSALDALQASLDVPGIAVAIAVGDRVVLAEGRGFADLDRGAPVTTDTRFRLASVSKLFTAATLARLVDAGKLEWDQKISELLPDFPDKGHPITPRQLAGHLGGIRNYLRRDFEGDRNIDQRHFATTAEALAIFAADPLLAPPGSQYHYSTLGYTLLMAVVEAASGADFLSALRAQVLEPLDLGGIREDRLGAVDEARTVFYERADNGFGEAGPVNPSYKWGGGGLLGSAVDLVRLGQAHFSPGFLREPTLNTVLRSQLFPDGRATGVGIGWRLAVDPWGRRVAHHAGSMSGGRSVLLAYPEDEVAVALLTNVALSPLAAEATAQLLADPFLYRRTTGRPATRVVLAGHYEVAIDGSTESGSIEFGNAKSDWAGSMTTPGLVRRYADRFSIPTPERLLIESVRIDGDEALIVVASPVGLFGIRAEFESDDFTGEIVALNAGALSGRLTARRLSGRPSSSRSVAAAGPHSDS